VRARGVPPQPDATGLPPQDYRSSTILSWVLLELGFEDKRRSQGAAAQLGSGP